MEETKTFIIKGADGKEAGKQTLPENLAPILRPGETAELEEPKGKAKPKPETE